MITLEEMEDRVEGVLECRWGFGMSSVGQRKEVSSLILPQYFFMLKGLMKKMKAPLVWKCLRLVSLPIG